MLRFCRRTQDPSLYGSGVSSPVQAGSSVFAPPRGPVESVSFSNESHFTTHSPRENGANEPQRTPLRALNDNKQRRNDPPQPHGPRLPRGPHPAHPHDTLHRDARARAAGLARGCVGGERLRTQKYVPGGHYAHHFDWGANVGGWGRVSSFMAWVGASRDLVGGGTEFPLSLRGVGGTWGGCIWGEMGASCRGIRREARWRRMKREVR